MSSSVPSNDVLVQAAADYLEQKLLPELEGYHRFQTLVTINVLRKVQRDLQLRDDIERQEGRSLSCMLGHTGELEDLRHELADAIRDGQLSLSDPQLINHLRASLKAALSVNNPRWIAQE